MRTVFSTASFTGRVYIASNRIIMPCMTLLVALAGLYAVAPARIADSYAYSMTVFFFVMVWIGMGFTEAEDPVSQQLVILRIGRPVLYYIARTLFVVCVGLALALFCIVFPLLMNLMRGGGLYKTEIRADTLLIGYALHTVTGFMGAAVGMALHPRIVPDRKAALLVALFVCLVGFVQAGIHNALPFTRFLTWVFPPISRVSEAFAGLDAFPPGAAAGVFVHFLVYGLVLSAIQIAVLVRRKFP